MFQVMHAVFYRCSVALYAILFALLQLLGQWLHVLGDGECAHFHVCDRHDADHSHCNHDEPHSHCGHSHSVKPDAVRSQSDAPLTAGAAPALHEHGDCVVCSYVSSVFRSSAIAGGQLLQAPSRLLDDELRVTPESSLPAPTVARGPPPQVVA